MLGFLLGLFRLVWLFGKGHQAVVLENLALRQQLSIYKRKQRRSVPGRARSVVLDRVVRGVEGVATSLVHCSSRHGGALAARKIPAVLGAAFKQIGKNRAASRQFSDSHIDSHLAQANPLWRAPRIHGEVKKLGIEVSERTVSRILQIVKRPPSQTWKTFLQNHVEEIVAIDFFGADDLPAGIVRVPGDRASAEKSSSLWGHRTSNRRMDRSASYRSFF